MNDILLFGALWNLISIPALFIFNAGIDKSFLVMLIGCVLIVVGWVFDVLMRCGKFREEHQ